VNNKGSGGGWGEFGGVSERWDTQEGHEGSTEIGNKEVLGDPANEKKPVTEKINSLKSRLGKEASTNSVTD